jgi:hypothetical protein
VTTTVVKIWKRDGSLNKYTATIEGAAYIVISGELGRDGQRRNILGLTGWDVIRGETVRDGTLVGTRTLLRDAKKCAELHATDARAVPDDAAKLAQIRELVFRLEQHYAATMPIGSLRILRDIEKLTR